MIGWVTSKREKAAKLEGRYVISRIKQNARLIFRKNLASWTDNQEAATRRCGRVAKMLWRGTFEYIERGMNGACGCLWPSRPSAGEASSWRLVTDAHFAPKPCQ